MRTPNWYVVLARHRKSGGEARELLLRAYTVTEALAQADLDLAQDRVMEGGKWQRTHRIVEARPAFIGEVAAFVHRRPEAQQRQLLVELGWAGVVAKAVGLNTVYTPVSMGTPKDVTPEAPAEASPRDRNAH